MGDMIQETGKRQETEERLETGERQETGETGNGKETGGGREIGGGRETEQETGERWEAVEGFSDVISEKFSTYNLVGEILKFLRTLIAMQKYKLALAAKWS